MNLRRLLRFFCLLAVFLALPAPVCLAVLLSAGNGNTDAASLLAAGGPGDPTKPGFTNVGVGTASGTVFYMGDRWVLTAQHVNTDNNVGTIKFSTGDFTIENGSLIQLKNPDNSLADLKLFRLTTDPGLPVVKASDIVTASPTSGQIYLIGNGLSRGAQHAWSVVSDVWTEIPIATALSTDKSGFDIAATRVIRWGDNDIAGAAIVANPNNGTTTVGVFTRFDDAKFTSFSPRTFESQATVGDSGGPGFVLVNGQWKLAGIVLAASNRRTNQPADTVLFGDQTFLADLSIYRSQIIAVVPEPGGAMLAACGLALLLAGVCGHRKRRA